MDSLFSSVKEEYNQLKTTLISTGTEKISSGLFEKYESLFAELESSVLSTIDTVITNNGDHDSVTADEFNTILDEIETETRLTSNTTTHEKDENKSCNNSDPIYQEFIKLPDSNQEIIGEAFENSQFCDNKSVQSHYWHSFCHSALKYGNEILPFDCDLNTLKDEKNKQVFIKYKWKDYVLHRINLFETLIYPMLIKNSTRDETSSYDKVEEWFCFSRRRFGIPLPQFHIWEKHEQILQDRDCNKK